MQIFCLWIQFAEMQIVSESKFFGSDTVNVSSAISIEAIIGQVLLQAEREKGDFCAVFVQNLCGQSCTFNDPHSSPTIDIPPCTLADCVLPFSPIWSSCMLLLSFGFFFKE